jgi:hypothetical protein
MTAARDVSRPTSSETYAARILGTSTAYEMNALADEIAHDRTIPDEDRRRLQYLYASRCRELWPHAYRRGRR